MHTAVSHTIYIQLSITQCTHCCSHHIAENHTMYTLYICQPHNMHTGVSHTVYIQPTIKVSAQLSSTHLYMYTDVGNIMYSSVQTLSVQDGIYMLGKAHMCTPLCFSELSTQVFITHCTYSCLSQCVYSSMKAL